MATALDELLAAPGADTDELVHQLTTARLAGETPEETVSREVATDRIKAKDLASRGIPSFHDAYGHVAPITDETGAALTHLDKRHGIAWDSAGQPKAISYDEGAPILNDPFAGIPVSTDAKTGHQYQKVKGLPWNWVGQDPQIAAQRRQQETDKALKAEATLEGQKLTLEHGDLVIAGQQVKDLKKQLVDPQLGVPELADPKYQGADLETVKKGIDAHFDAEYGSPEANEKAGWFNDELSPAAIAKRADIDKRKAATHETATQLFDTGAQVNELATSAQTSREKRRAMQETLIAHKEGRLGPLDPEYQQSQFDDQARQAFEEKKAALEASFTNPTGSAATRSAATGLTPDSPQAVRTDVGDHIVGQLGVKPGIWDKVKGFIGEVVGAGATTVSKGLEGFAQASEAIYHGVFGGDEKATATRSIIYALQKVPGVVTNPALKDTTEAKAGRLVGEYGSLIGEAILNPAIAVTNMVGLGYEGQHDAAAAYFDAQAKANPDKPRNIEQEQATADRAGVLGAAINGVLAMVPIGKAGAAIKEFFGKAETDVVAKALNQAYERGGAGGVANVLNELKGAMAKTGSPAFAEVASKGLQGVIDEISKSPADRLASVAGRAVTDAGWFSAAQVGQNLVSKTYNPDTGLFENVPSAAATGAVLGTIGGTFEQVARANKARQAEIDIKSALAKQAGVPPPPEGGLPAPASPEPTKPAGPTEKVVTGTEVAPTTPVEKGGGKVGEQEIKRLPEGEPPAEPIDTEVEGARTPAAEKPADTSDSGRVLTPNPEPRSMSRPDIERELGGMGYTVESDGTLSKRGETVQPQEARAVQLHEELQSKPIEKGKQTFDGVDVTIHNEPGEVRKEGHQPLQTFYGSINEVKGADGGNVDVLVKAGTTPYHSGPVFVIDQTKADGGFDEHKVVVGAKSGADAVATYNGNYPKGWDRIGRISQFGSLEKAKEFLQQSQPKPTEKPKGEVVKKLGGGLSYEQATLRKLATGVLNQHKVVLTSLGHTEAVEGTTESSSGIETNADNKITFDWAKLHEATKGLSPRARTKYIQRAVAEEVLHVAGRKWAGEKPENRQSIVTWGGEKDELDGHMAGAYAGWEKLSDEQKGHEKLRAVLQKRWTGKLTEAAYKALRDFLKYLRGIWDKLTPEQKTIVGEVEARMGRETSPTERPPPEKPPSETSPTEMSLAERRTKKTALEERHNAVSGRIPAKERQIVRTLLHSNSPVEAQLRQAENIIAKYEGGENAVQKPSATGILQHPPEGAGEQTGGRVQPGEQGPEKPAETRPPEKEKPSTGQPSEESALTEAGRLAAFKATGMPEKEAIRLSKVAPRYLMPNERAVLDDYAKRMAKPAIKSALDEASQQQVRDAFEGLAAAPPVQSIKAPAIRLKDGTIVNVPEGKLNWHASAVDHSIATHGAKATTGFEKGYITTNGHFLTKTQAWKTARIGSSLDLDETQRSALGAAEPRQDPLIGAAVVPIQQKPIPDDKIGAFVNLARMFLAKGIDTPEALIKELEALVPVKGRSYAQATWDLMVPFRPALRGEHDWTTIVNRELAAAGLSGVGNGPHPSGTGVAPEAGGTTQGGQTGAVPQPRGEQDAGVSGQNPAEQPATQSGGGTGARPPDVGAPAKPGQEPEPAPESGSEGTTGTIQGETGGGDRGELDENARNHVIAPEDEIAPAGQITRIRANISAIRLLKKLEADNRNATPEEKRVLASYTGWGDKPQVFDAGAARSRDWSPESAWAKKYGSHYDQLKELLTTEEYEAARASTLNAHFTSHEVMRPMWDLVRQLGFKGGIVAEWGGGVGHFFGTMPQDLAANSRLQAIERDLLSARIMTKLYPQARVRNAALQDVRTPPNSVDLFVGNVPFAQDGPRDKAYPELNLHNYFIARQLDALRPGGIAVVISSSFTLDAQSKQREYLVSKGELIGAIRLPNTAFKANAGTEVTTDILVLRKPDTQRPAPESWVATASLPLQVGKGEPLVVNEYYGRHPDMILGLASRAGTMYGPDEPAILPFPGKDLGELLSEAIKKLPSDLFGAMTQPAPDSLDNEPIEARPEDKIGSLIYRDGKLHVVSDREGGKQLVPAGDVDKRLKPAEVVKRAKDFIGLRDHYKSLIAQQLDPEATDEQLAESRAELNRLYDTYTKRHGPLNAAKSKPFSNDPEYGLLMSLESRRSVEKDGKRVREYVKAPVFTERTQRPYSEPTTAGSVRDGMLISLGYRGRILPEYIATLTNKSVGDVETAMENENLAFLDPESGAWQTNDLYLSGYVKQKLRAAEHAAEIEPRYQRNVDALKPAQPKAVTINEIGVRLGGSWIPQEVVTNFGRDLFVSRKFYARYMPAVDVWISETDIATPEATSTYGGGGVDGPSLLRLALNLKQPKVYDRIRNPDGTTRQVFNAVKTAAAQAAQDRINSEFRRYVLNNADAGHQVEIAYNDAVGGHVAPTSDGSHLTLPGSSEAVKLRPTQKNAVWRIIQHGYSMVAHAVGAGKTYVLAAGAMEMRRLGLAQKPLIVVQNSTLGQFATSFRKMYPSANVLVGTKEDLSKPERNKFMARIASGNWDAVVVAKSSFDLLPNDPAREVAYIREQLQELEDALREARARENKRSPSVKELEKQRNKLRDKLQELMKRPQDNAIKFEELGVDALFVDEAHDYKKPPFVTKLGQIAGLNTQVSQRGFALLMKTRFIQEKNKGRNVILATGTPITNTLGEAWHMLNLGAPHLLKQFNVDTFDRFVGTFARVEPDMDVNAAGNWVIKPRLKKFVNQPELTALIRTGWDVLITEDLHDMLREQNIEVPRVAGGRTRNVVCKLTPPIAAYQSFLREVYEAYRQESDKKAVSYVPIMCFMSGKAACLDPRLIDVRAQDHPESKVNAAVADILRIYKETAANKSTQLVFADSYRTYNISALRAYARGEGISFDMAAEDQGLEETGGFNLWDDIKKKLVAGGVKPEEIANINDYEKPEEKEQLFDAVNAGEIRVLMGGTQKMGVGVNVQEKVIALHHLDPPWLPAWVEQREGRAIRQGNENSEVAISVYGVEKSLESGLYRKLVVKAKMNRQLLSGKLTAREFDDPTGPLILSADEQMALLSGNPLVLRKVEVDNNVRNLMLEREGWLAGQAETRSRLRWAEGHANHNRTLIAAYEPVLEKLRGLIDGENWKAKIGAVELTDKKQIIATLDKAIKSVPLTKDVDSDSPTYLRNKGQSIITFDLNGVRVVVSGGLYTSFLQGSKPEPAYGSQMYIGETEVYEGHAKTGIGLVNAASELPESTDLRVKTYRLSVESGEADAAKFRALLNQPFERQSELDEAQAEQARIDRELLTGAAPSPTADAAKELLDIGYSAQPLLMRIDAQLAGAEADLALIKKLDGDTDTTEARIKALTARRAVVEKRRYEAALRDELTVPYGWTPTGDERRPLAAATPQKIFEELKAKAAPGLEILTDIRKGIQSLLLPTAQSPEHLRAAEDLGAELGPMHHRQEASRHNLNPDWFKFEKMGIHREDLPLVKNPAIQFMSDVSQGRDVAPALQKTAEKLEKEFQSRVKLLAEVGAPLSTVRENYFPGMWTRESREALNLALEQAVAAGIINENFSAEDEPATSTKIAWIHERVEKLLESGEGSERDMLAYVARRPIKGRESFRKQKVFDDIMTAVRLGLVPVSTNPIDLVMLKLAEMDKSIMANGYFKKLRAKDQERQISPYEKAPEGWMKVPDKYGTIYGPPTVQEREYVDKGIYDGLMKVARGMGINPERAFRAGRGKLGFASTSGQTVSQFATELSVLAHEIGHQLDFKYDLWDKIVAGATDIGKSGKVTKAASATKRGQIHRELRALADLTWEGSNPDEVSEHYKRKVRNRAEKMAHMLEAYIHAPSRFKEVAPMVFEDFEKFIKSNEETKGLADIKPGIALTQLTNQRYVGLPIMGYRIVPNVQGDILTNYLSSSLYNNKYFGKMFTGWMGFANALNQTQLGVGSGFHAGFTTAEAQISSGANVIQDIYGLLRGNRTMKDLLGSFKRMGSASVETAMTGDKVLNAWRNPDGEIDPRIAQVVRAAELAGAGFKLEMGLKTEQSAKFISDWFSGHKLKAGMRSPVAFVELMAKPIMEFLVPRQKAGVFAHMVWRIIEMNPDKSLDQLVPELRQAWNRIDARLGQVRYDRLFINNIAKNVVQGGIRAPGWSGGTIAELGGAFKDAYKFFEEWAKTGKLPQNIPPRVSYVLSLLVFIVATNALLTFLFTGEKPEGLDYWAFRDGSKDERGNPGRLVLPTYAKDILAYAKEPLTTLINKLHPLLSIVGDLFRNKDYYGVEIRDSDANALKQAIQSGAYLAKSFEPFWIRGTRKELKREAGARALLPLIGVMPAPRKITETSAEALASEINKAMLPATPLKEKQAERRIEKSEITSKIRRGINPDVSSALARGAIKPSDVKELYRRGSMSPLAGQIDHMTLENAERVYAKASASEKRELAGIMARKRQGSASRATKGKLMFTGF